MDTFLAANAESEAPPAPDNDAEVRQAQNRLVKGNSRESGAPSNRRSGRRSSASAAVRLDDDGYATMDMDETGLGTSRISPLITQPETEGIAASIIDDVFCNLLRSPISSASHSSVFSVDEPFGWRSVRPEVNEILKELRAAFANDTKRACHILDYLSELVASPSDSPLPSSFTHPLLETFQSLLESACNFPSSMSPSSISSRDLVLLLLATVSTFLCSKCHEQLPENPFTSPENFIHTTISVLVDMYYAEYNAAYSVNGLPPYSQSSSFSSSVLKNPVAPMSRLLSALARICRLPETFAFVTKENYPNQVWATSFPPVISSLHSNIYAKGKELRGPSRLATFGTKLPCSEISLLYGFLGICAYFGRAHGLEGTGGGSSIYSSSPVKKWKDAHEYYLLNRLLSTDTSVLSKIVMEEIEKPKVPKLLVDPMHLRQLSKELRWIARIFGSKTINSPENHNWLQQVGDKVLKLLAYTNYPHSSEDATFRCIPDERLPHCLADAIGIFEEAGTALDLSAAGLSVAERLRQSKQSMTALRDVTPFHECAGALLDFQLQYALIEKGLCRGETKLYCACVLKYVENNIAAVKTENSPQKRLLITEHCAYTLLSAACAGVFESTNPEFAKLITSLFADVDAISGVGLLVPMCLLRSKIFCCLAGVWNKDASVSDMVVRELTKSIVVATKLLHAANQLESSGKSDKSCINSAQMLAICSAMTARAIKSLSESNASKDLAVRTFTTVAEVLVKAAVVVSQSLDLGCSGDVCIRCVLAASRASSGFCLKHVLASVDISAVLAAPLPVASEPDEFDEYGSLGAIDFSAIAKAEAEKANEIIHAMSSLKPVLSDLRDLISFSKPSSRAFQFAANAQERVTNTLSLSIDGSSLIARNVGAFATCVVNIIGLVSPKQVSWQVDVEPMVTSNNEKHLLEDQSHTRPVAQFLSADICRLALKNDTCHSLVKDGWLQILKNNLDCVLDARIIERFPTMNFDLLEEMAGDRRNAVVKLHKVEEKAVKAHKDVLCARVSNKDAHAAGIKVDVKKRDAIGEPGPQTMARRLWTFSYNLGCLLKYNEIGCGIGDIFLSCSDLTVNAPFKSPFCKLRLGSLENECGKRVALLTKLCAEVIEKKGRIREGVVTIVTTVGYGLMRNVRDLIAGEILDNGDTPSAKKRMALNTALKKAYCELAVSVVSSLLRVLAPDHNALFGEFSKDLRELFFMKAAIGKDKFVARPDATSVLDAMKKMNFKVDCSLAARDPHVVEAVKRRTRELLVHCGNGRFTEASSTLGLYDSLLRLDGGTVVGKLVGERVSSSFSALSMDRDELQLAIDNFFFNSQRYVYGDTAASSFDDETSLGKIRTAMLRDCVRKIASENEEVRPHNVTAQIMARRHEALQVARDLLRFYRDEENANDNSIDSPVPCIELSLIVPICSALVKSLQYGLIQLEHERDMSQESRTARETSNISPSRCSVLYSLSLTIECLDRALSLVVDYRVDRRLSLLRLSALENVHGDAEHAALRVCSKFSRFVNDAVISHCHKGVQGISSAFDWKSTRTVHDQSINNAVFSALWDGLKSCKLNVVWVEEGRHVAMPNQYATNVPLPLPGGFDGEESHLVLLRKNAKNLNAKIITHDGPDADTDP